MRALCPRPVTAAAVLLLAAACGERGPRGGGAEGGAPVPGGTAVVAEPADMGRPSPLTYASTLDSDLVDIMYMSLTRLAWHEGEPVFMLADESPMAMAERWEYLGADSAALRYYLRPGLRWSDGRPITAHDVEWTYTALADPRVDAPRRGDAALVDSVRARSDTVVDFHFRRRSPSMRFQAGLPIAPRHALGDVPRGRIARHPSIDNPIRLVVSGAFRVGAWRPNERITLVPNPYFRVRPRLSALVIRIIPDPTTRLTELQTGQIDVARVVSTDRVKGLRERMPEVRILREEKRFWEYVSYNPRRVPAFRDAQVRRALGMAVDVPAIVRGLELSEFVTPAYGPYPPIFRGFTDSVRHRPLAYDPEGARRILAARGWRDTDGDGVVEKDGRPFRFTLVTNAGNQRRADVSQLLQRYWRAVGVQVELRQMDLNTVLDMQEKHRYEAALGGWGVALDPDITEFFTPGNPRNVVAYDEPQATALLRRAQAATTAGAALPLWRAAAERIVQDQPYTWLYYYDVLSAAGARVRGMKVDTYGAFQNTWEWWIPRELQRR